MSLFIDTSALYALLVGSEKEHSAIARTFRAAAERGRPLVTTSYVLLETIALLQHRIGLEAVRDLETHLSPLLHIHWVDQELHRRGVTRLFRVDRRAVSLVDAVSFTVMEDEGVSDVLGLDAAFAAQGFTLLPETRR